VKRAAAVAVFLLTFVGRAYAVLPDEQLKDPKLEARARVISQDLRCVVCQNQTIDDSDAPLAHDLRVLLRERLLKGDSDAGAEAYIVKRYGTFVLLKPPFQSDTLALWLGPLAVLILGAAGATYYLRAHAHSAPTASLSAKEEAEVNRMLER
jgi:cytochrome c-type biogenesis protein CcmH